MDGLKLKKYMETTRKKFDPTALLLSIVGLVGVVLSIGYQEDLSTYFDMRSILVVVCGTFASILFQFDFSSSLYSLKLILKSFFQTPDKATVKIITTLDEAIIRDMSLTELAEGADVNGDLLNDVVYMHKQGLVFEEIDDFVTSRISDEFLGRRVAVDLLRRAAIIAPALGLFGTVIGLIGVLKSLSDPSMIGPSMSLALMTTAYGAALGSLVFTPLAGRLEHHNTIYLEAHQQLLAKMGILLRREERDLSKELVPGGIGIVKIVELAQGQEEESLTSFYISFSDLMVLLGVFFVMLISMSKIDIGSFEKIKTSFSGDTKGTLIELARELKEIVEGVPGVPGVTVQMAEDGVRLNLDTGTLFDTGSAKLKPNALDPLIPLLESIGGTKYTIDVEGHTDDVPLYRYYKVDGERTLETNWSLSGRRASSVIHFLLNFGIHKDRVRMVGYASTRPLTSIEGKTGKELSKARAENRRVSLLIK